MSRSSHLLFHHLNNIDEKYKSWPLEAGLHSGTYLTFEMNLGWRLSK
jgi:hypothetical protein